MNIPRNGFHALLATLILLCSASSVLGNVTDSDGDGVNDYREGKDGTNPNNASSFNPLSKGLVAYYPFNGNANDESGNGKAATLSANSTFQSGFSSRQALKIVGNGFFFRENTAEFPSLDKSNAGQFVEIPEPSLINPHIFSSSIWVNEEGMTHSHGESYITAGYGSKSMPLIANYYLINENSSLSSQTKLTDSNPGPDLQTSVKLDTIQNVWTNYMVVCDGIDLTVYKNGIIIHSGNVFGKPQGNWSIGRHWWDNGGTFSTRFIGLVADCRIYNRALTAAEVSQLYSKESENSTMVPVQGGTLPQGSGLAGQVVGDFRIGKYEVTWGEWKSVRDWAVANGYSDLANVGAASGEDHAVRDVNWFDIVKWCNAKSQMEGLVPVYSVNGATYKTGQSLPTVNATANGYRLPVEKEWEWAARGGVASKGYTYSGGNDLNTVAWYYDNSDGAVVNLYFGKGSWPVGTKLANELGLFDMSGGIWEWCEDLIGSLRMCRGGSWGAYDYYCAVGWRNDTAPPDRRHYGLGFRLARNADGPADITAPEITSAAEAYGIVGEEFSYQIAADNNPTSFGAKNLPAGLNLNSTTGAITGRPTRVGSTNATISATNSAGTTNASLRIQVVAAAPVITGSTSVSGTVGAPFTYQITASNSPTSYGAIGLPGGLKLNNKTGLITGTPTSSGLFSVALTASNSGGTGRANITIRVTVARPTITGDRFVSGRAGSPFRYQIKATNNPRTFGASGLPNGLRVNSKTGLISGTPRASGVSNVTISATNAAGTGKANLSIRVLAPRR